jgi:hypothetical protein
MRLLCKYFGHKLGFIYYMPPSNPLYRFRACNRYKCNYTEYDDFDGCGWHTDFKKHKQTQNEKITIGL